MRGFSPPPELELFEALLEERLGLSLASLRRGDHLEGALRERARARGCADLRAYWRALIQPGTAAEELRALARRLTVGETYFFREPQQIAAFTEVAIPERLAARGGGPVRVLSAGCASGEEAYTLAIALQLAGPGIDARRVRIDGIDLNPAAIERARATRFSWWALRATPAHVRELCFTTEGQDFELRADLRPRVSFEERNLVEDDPAFWRAGAFDVIFCRNVLMYLAPEKARAVIERIARALAPGGFLFLSSSEPLHDPAPAFDVASTHDTFYYRRSDEGASWRAAVDAVTAASASRVPEGAAREVDGAARDGGGAAQDGDGAARDGEVVADAPAASVRADDAAWRARALIARERYDDALARLRALPEPDAADAEVQLLLAVALCQRGEIREAEHACDRALAAGDRGGAHYVLGLCLEHAGDLARAAQRYQAAAWLDPTFAMPHLRLGLLAKRAGDAAALRTALGRAASLLAAEPSERIALFGGGFERRALIELCEVELRAPRGRP